MLSSTASVKNFSTATVYTARDFTGYTLQHLKAMYPRSWQEAAHHYGVPLPEPTVEQIKQTAIAKQVWDFYPTTTPIIQKMLNQALIQPHHRVLEPSAGSGDLARAISLRQCSANAKVGVKKIDCFEINLLLQKALRFQDFNVLGSDFLASNPQPIYDRVIANPPFSSNGVNRHTRHAFEFLKPGGRLITLAHHYNLKPNKSDRSFFTWLKQHRAKFLNLGSAFKHSDRPTNVSLQLIVVDKSVKS